MDKNDQVFSIVKSAIGIVLLIGMAMTVMLELIGLIYVLIFGIIFWILINLWLDYYFERPEKEGYLDYLNSWTLVDMPWFKYDFNKDNINYVDRFDATQISRRSYGRYPAPSRSSVDTVTETVPYAKGFSLASDVPILQKIPQTDPRSGGGIVAQDFLFSTGAYGVDEAEAYLKQRLKLPVRTEGIQPLNARPPPIQEENMTVEYTRYEKGPNGAYGTTHPYKVESTNTTWAEKSAATKLRTGYSLPLSGSDRPDATIIDRMEITRSTGTAPEAAEIITKKYPGLNYYKFQIVNYFQNNQADLRFVINNKNNPKQLETIRQKLRAIVLQPPPQSSLGPIRPRSGEEFTESPDVYFDDRYDPTTQATARNMEKLGKYYPYDEQTSRAPSNDKSDPKRIQQYFDPNKYLRKDPLTGLVTNWDEMVGVDGQQFSTTKTYLGDGNKVITGLEYKPVEITPQAWALPENHPYKLGLKHTNAARYNYNVSGRFGVERGLVQDVMAYRSHDWNSTA